MEFNKTACPHALVLVDNGIPCILQRACGKISCPSAGCKEEAMSRPCTCPHVNDYYQGGREQLAAMHQAAACLRHKA